MPAPDTESAATGRQTAAGNIPELE